MKNKIKLKLIVFVYILFVFSGVCFSLFFYSNINSATNITSLNLENKFPQIKLSDNFKTFDLPRIKGAKLDLAKPLNISFYLDKMNKDNITTKETQRLIRYFLGFLTVPNQKIWVNLSPYESDKIMPEVLTGLDIGKDLLLQDYILKLITSFFSNPNNAIGRKYWEKLQKEFGGSRRVNIFNKIWIVPEKTIISEYKKSGQIVVLVKEAKLKVMMQEDYLASSGQRIAYRKDGYFSHLYAKRYALNAKIKEIFKKELLPLIEREVNEGANFAGLRQLYYSLILATYFKEKMGRHPLYRQYIDQEKVEFISEVNPKTKDLIYQAYLRDSNKARLKLFDKRKMEYRNYSYFSGGFKTAREFLQIQEQDKIGTMPVSLNGKEVTIELNSLKFEAKNEDDDFKGRIEEEYKDTKSDPIIMRRPRLHPRLFKLMQDIGRENDYNKRLILLLEAQSIDKDDPVIKSCLAKCYLVLRRYNEAKEAIVKAITLLNKVDNKRYRNWLNKQLIYSYGIYSDILLKLNKEQEALTQAKKIIEIDSDDYIAYGHLAKIYINMEKYDKALAAAQEYIKLLPDRVIGYIYMAKAYLGSNMAKELLEVADKIIKMGKALSYGYGYKIKAYIMLEQLDKALTLANKYVQEDPLNPIAYGYKAIVCLELDQINEMLELAKKNIELDKDDPVGHSLKAKAHIILHQAKEALLAAEEIVRIEPEGIFGYKYKAMAFFMLGDFANLYSMGEKINNLDGNHFLGDWYKSLAILSEAFRNFILDSDLNKLRLSLKDKIANLEDNCREKLCNNNWLNYFLQDNHKYIPLPKAIRSPNLRHIMNDHILREGEDLNKGDYSIFFPEDMPERDVLCLVRQAKDKAVAINQLPEGDKIYWWPDNIFISYIYNREKNDWLRLVVVGDKNGEVITIYPTMGKGVKYYLGFNLWDVSHGVLGPANLMLWNKNSQLPVKLLVGNEQEGFLAIFLSPILAKLNPIEREQLVWLAIIDGQPVKDIEDENDIFYKYKIKYKTWKDRLGVEEILIKVDKKTWLVKNIYLNNMVALMSENKGGIDFSQTNKGLEVSKYIARKSKSPLNYKLVAIKQCNWISQD